VTDRLLKPPEIKVRPDGATCVNVGVLPQVESFAECTRPWTKPPKPFTLSTVYVMLTDDFISAIHDARPEVVIGGNLCREDGKTRFECKIDASVGAVCAPTDAPTIRLTCGPTPIAGDPK
jgi:hypothetical protein